MEKFLAIWNALPSDDETSAYQYEDGDRFVLIDGYIFIVQTRDGYNNIVFKLFTRPSRTLKSVLSEFREWLIENHIQYIRIDGLPKRYHFLPKMFPDSSFIQDRDIKDRTRFYVRIY